MHRTSKAAVVAAFQWVLTRFGTGCQRNGAGVITCGIALTLVVHGANDRTLLRSRTW
jgi:hypothetical protein